MNKIKNSNKVFLGILLAGLFGAVIPITAQGQTGANSKDVNVTNTPTVTLATGATVGINPANNTVKLDVNAPVTVRAEGALLIYDQTISIPEGVTPIVFTAPVNVSAFSKIRVVAITNGQSVTVVTVMHLDEGGIPGIERISLDDISVLQSNRFTGTKLYELTGHWVSFTVDKVSEAVGARTIQIQVYGKR